MDNRIFQLDTQWNIIHYPEKPNGFGILIIGDERHFVDESKSFWLQNEGKQFLIQNLKESGYTIFSSNLYGRNWGSRRAVQLAQRLYQHIIRNEIMNEKIHILAEGMGALVAMSLFKEMKDQIRSAVLVNPILSLNLHLEQEKEHKFFYKKLLNELSYAYQKDIRTIESEILKNGSPVYFDADIPVKLFHILAGGRIYPIQTLSKASK
ncbi:hydrolase [Neobacillus sp. PS3-34]|uniref:hydrolase n=1 Tax=Neobacillus sp. PS3-34 TaxID=3070678 RepID=UPI0027DFFB0C|nr:hydrolase [Neobacillus sp. PS3-34]WML49577.1 hydrolase [Neobacillus sp. PS3-34]